MFKEDGEESSAETLARITMATTYMVEQEVAMTNDVNDLAGEAIMHIVENVCEPKNEQQHNF